MDLSVRKRRTSEEEEESQKRQRLDTIAQLTLERIIALQQASSGFNGAALLPHLDALFGLMKREERTNEEEDEEEPKPSSSKSATPLSNNEGPLREERNAGGLESIGLFQNDRFFCS